MCVVSMIGDQWGHKYTDPRERPGFVPNPYPGIINRMANSQTVTKEEFDKLRADVEELKQLLKAAKAYDERTNQKDCEVEEKVELLRRVAKLVGVDLSEVL